MILLSIMLFDTFMEYDKYLTRSLIAETEFVLQSTSYIFGLSLCGTLRRDLANLSPASDVKIDLKISLVRR